MRGCDVTAPVDREQHFFLHVFGVGGVILPAGQMAEVCLSRGGQQTFSFFVPTEDGGCCEHAKTLRMHVRPERLRLVRETGLEFNFIRQLHHILCNAIFAEHDIWRFCFIIYNAVKPFLKL